MILVWSTSDSPASMAPARTCWRMRTTSSDERISCTSLLVVGIGSLRLAQPLTDEIQAALHIESGLHARQGQAQLDKRDGDGRTHADDDRVGIENARDAGDIGQHAANEA